MGASRCQAVRCATLLLLLSSGCEPSGAPEGTDTAPALLLQDSIALQDPAFGPVGKPWGLIALSDGGYLVGDVMTKRVLKYDAAGALRGVIGGEGTGPGEFKRLGPFAVDGDSVLYVLDGTTLDVMDLRTGAYRERTTLPVLFPQSVAAAAGKLYFRSLDSSQVPHLSAWGREGVVEGPALPAASELEPVRATGASEVAAMMNTTHSGAVFAVLGGGRVAVLSQSSEDVLVATLEGVTDRIPVARARRRGVRADVLARLAADPGVTRKDPQLAYTPSVPAAVGMDGAGRYVSVKADYTVLPDHFAASLYLSVSDPRSQLTCPDALVPGPEDPTPSVALRGDTLMVLSHEIRGDAAVPLIRRYVIRTSSCRWDAPAPG